MTMLRGTMKKNRRAVLRVGEGRGFIIRQIGPAKIPLNLVITAAHCLPKLPPAHAFSYTEDRTYQNLLSSLDSDKRHVWAECIFVDPIADIAGLWSPDGQELYEQAEAYDALTDVPAVSIVSPRTG